jgi:hypothetical protein
MCRFNLYHSCLLRADTGVRAYMCPRISSLSPMPLRTLCSDVRVSVWPWSMC